MKTLTVKREGTSTEFSYEIVWDGSYERLAGCVENLKLLQKGLHCHRQHGFRTVSGRGKKCTVPAV